MTANAQPKLEATELDLPLIIESRFGEIVIRENDVVYLPQGIYGFEDYHTFAIIGLPGEHPAGFRVLQCLDEIGLVFLLMPLLQNNVLMIPESDLREATDYLGVKFRSCDFYAMTSIGENKGSLEFSLNLKAPVVVDRTQKKAWQYILEKSEYPVRHVVKA